MDEGIRAGERREEVREVRKGRDGDEDRGRTGKRRRERMREGEKK